MELGTGSGNFDEESKINEIIPFLNKTKENLLSNRFLKLGTHFCEKIVSNNIFEEDVMRTW